MEEGIWENAFIFENVDILVVGGGFFNWCKVPQASKGLIFSRMHIISFC